MSGYFGIGVEGISKAANVGALLRTAHAFGAAFAFTVDARTDLDPRSEAAGFRAADTSDAVKNLPFYSWPSPAAVELPQGCRVVGIELMDEAIELPSFRHPRRAAYVLGSERGGLSPAMLERCDFVCSIPTRFSINLSLAGALVMYDRLISRERFAPRPLMPGGPTEDLPPHVHGNPVLRGREGS